MINSFNFTKSILLELEDPYFTAYLIFCLCLLVMLVKFKCHYNLSLYCKESTDSKKGKKKSFLLMNRAENDPVVPVFSPRCTDYLDINTTCL